MAVTLTGCTLFKNDDSSIDRYEISFTSDIIPSRLLNHVVKIRASDVDDITDMDQVKAAAIAKIESIETFVQKEESQTSQDISL